MQCLKRSKSEPDKGLVIAIAALVRNAGYAEEFLAKYLGRRFESLADIPGHLEIVK